MTAPPSHAGDDRASPLAAILTVTFLGSVSGGAFWSGLFFVTAEHYRFSPERNLVLAIVMGGVYALCARFIGALLGAVAPRTGLLGALGGWAAVGLLPVLFPRSEPVLWLSAVLGTAGSASTWPIVESYLTAGRHGPAMRAAIGRFNTTWAPATAVPLLAMPFIARIGITWTIGCSAIVNLAAIVVVVRHFPPRPGAHAVEEAHAALGPEYRLLLRSASLLLPLSYVISATLAPLLPHRLALVGAGIIAPTSTSAVAALWMVARFVTLGTMWRTGGWHGRWETLAAGAVALVGGLALVLLSPSLVGIVIGLLLYGTGMGLTYYASLYYAMAVGHAAVEAGGNFEALIGVGYCVGPLLGVAGHAASASHADAATVGFTWLALAIAAPFVVRPYLAARRARRSRAV
jgi:hypothetical protein